MPVRFPLLLACALATVVAPGVALCADLAFAVNYLAGSRQIVNFPVGNPAAMTVVGPQADTLVGMDFDPSASVLWAVNFTAQTIGTVNQTTGAHTASAMLQGGCCITAFTIDPVGGKFYVSKGDANVYELHPTTGITTLLAQGAVAGAQITALAFDCTGRMFAADGDPNSGNIYRVHFDGSPTLVGFPGIVSATSLEFDNQSGNLYGWFNATGNDSSTHANVDATTAQLSQSSVLSGKYRMAIRNMCSAEQLRLFADGFEG